MGFQLSDNSVFILLFNNKTSAVFQRSVIVMVMTVSSVNAHSSLKNFMFSCFEVKQC